MHFQLYLTFVLATTILMLIPGPNVALIVANGVGRGPRYGLLTVAGTSSAMIIQLALVSLGVSELLGNFAHLFELLRWLGAGYLLYLGIKQWVAAPVDLTRTRPQTRSMRAIYFRGLVVSLNNPKTLLFFGAFFPQFLVPSKTYVAGQMLLLSGTFLAVAIVVDSGWALLAGQVRMHLARYSRLLNRMSGGTLIGAGVGMALARRR
jgi:threonine/homoserine/homoserine lactone efflux protein